MPYGGGSMPHPVAEETASGYAFVALVGLRAEDPIGIFRAVQKGLSFAALETFQRRSGLSTADLADAVVITARTFARRKEQGRLEPEESDRLLRVARVFARTDLGAREVEALADRLEHGVLT